VDATLTLTIINGSAAGSLFRFRGCCHVVVGRARDADIRLDDRHVSRHHVLLEINAPSCRLVHLPSAGGEGAHVPRINGERARNRELSDGDVIELGHTHLRFGVEWREAAPGPEPGASPHRGVKSKSGKRAPRCLQCGRALGGEDFKSPAFDRKDGAIYVCQRCLPEGDGSAGSVIGDYELRRILGTGKMGAVYLAWHHRTNTLVALKKIKDLGAEWLNQRFETEVRVLRRLAHPGIAGFIDSGLHDGAAFIVTEYVSGESLQRSRSLEPLLPVQTAVRTIAGVLGILQDMHARLFVHGDIKPHNILLTGQGNSGDPVLKLREFGFALFYERAGAMKASTPGERLESIKFMAPERAGGMSEASVLSDIYSVGATLYYLVSGQLPFDFPAEDAAWAFDEQRAAFRSPIEAVRALRKVERMLYPDEILKREKTVCILDRNRGLGRNFASVVNRSVSKEPKARFQTSAEFRDALLDAAARDAYIPQVPEWLPG
jgi:eukaryotic-like serine/threonine-protein kinase